MKILIIDTDYGAFIRSFYQEHPGLEEKSYNEQKKVLAAKAFGQAFFFGETLRKMGHDAQTIILNNEILQRAWAREHDIKLKSSLPIIGKWLTPDWQKKILKEQIKAFRPDVLYWQVLLCDNAFQMRLKKYAKLYVLQIAAKLPKPKYFKPYDLVVSSLPNQVEHFKKYGKNAKYLKLAFKPNILKRLTKTNTPYDVTHIGGYGTIHNERNAILEAVAQTLPLDTWGCGTDNLRPNSPILKRYHGEAWGLDMYNILYNSKITLTGHIKKVAGDYANNMTLYEATGAGCLLLTDNKKNIGEIFELGKEIDTYDSAPELIEKIRYYLTHENERQQIAEAGQRRTLKEHSYETRLKELMPMLEEALAQK